MSDEESKVTVDVWDRLPTEDDTQWGAFRNYRDMLPPRRIKDASIKSTATLSAWYNQFNWAARVLAYDQHLDQMRRAEREALIKADARERAARHLSLVHGVQDVLDRELAKLAADSTASEAWGLLKVGEFTALMESAIKLERLVRGETTENVGVKRDLSKLSLDELRTLRDLEKKVAVDEDEQVTRPALKVVK